MWSELELKACTMCPNACIVLRWCGTSTKGWPRPKKIVWDSGMKLSEAAKEAEAFLVMLAGLLVQNDCEPSKD